MILSYIFCDPPREAFTIPLINHPIVWYSLFFAGGFFVGYLLVAYLLSSFLRTTTNALPQLVKKTTFGFLDRLAWYIFLGMLIGARLGHVIFYDWPHYEAHPLKILYTWEGGLSSHGGAIGLLIALAFFWWRHKTHLPQLSFKQLLDYLCIGTAFVAGSIRIGNFFNQEILGHQSDLPFAVWFGHPTDIGAKMPCHPVQLYEALFYFLTCAYLFLFRSKLSAGKISGLFFVSVFTFRFFIEFLKLPQSIHDGGGLYMGQLLSLPFIMLGLFLLFNKK